MLSIEIAEKVQDRITKDGRPLSVYQVVFETLKVLEEEGFIRLEEKTK